MALMTAALHDASKSAGDEAARKAAEAVAACDNRFAKLEGEAILVEWTVGFNLAPTAAVSAELLA